MREYCPVFVLTGRMFELVSDIMEIIGRLDKFDNLNDMPVLRKNNKIRSIHSSLVIENNSFNIDEVRDIISGREVIGPINEIREVKNIYTLYEKMDELNPYILSDLLRSHRILLSGIDKENGKFRLGNEGVFDGENCIFIAPPPHMVNILIDNLFKYINDSYEFLHPLILSSIFHYEFVFIHPFTDGNGRMARLWHSAILAKWQPIFEFIPIESQIEKFQSGYYDAISKCHIDGTSTAFIEFILEQINAILDEVGSAITSPGSNISEYVTKLLNVMEFDTPYTANEILSLLGLKSKEALRKNYLNPAISDGFVIMTEPDKPNSRNQRYIKK